MPYKFGEYVSTYVDPQSVAISETLRSRFMENFKANDQLAMAVDQMKAALPFENDVKKKAELQTEIDKTLTTLSDRGDYENLGFAVHKATKEFSQKYAPIKENYDRYQAAIADLDKRYKAKEIDAEVYARSGSYITRNYKGFEIDPNTGKAKEGTMFSAPTIYNDPNITDKMIKALSIIKPDKYQNKSNRLAVGPDGAYTVTSESGVEQVPPEDIQAAFDYVMADPNVAMAVQQKADMRAYDLQKSGNIPTAINQTITQYNDLITKYTAEMSKSSMSKAQKAEYQKAINSMKSEINKATLASQDETTAYNYIKSRIEQEIVAPTKNWAMLAAYKHTSSSTIYDYDPIWKSMRESAMKQAEAAMPIYTQTEARAIENGGATVTEKTQTIDRLKARNAEIDQELTGALDETAKGLLRNEKSSNISQIALQEYHIAKAKQAGTAHITMASLEKQDPTLVGVVREMLPQNATAGDVYNAMERIFDNTGDQDYQEFVARFDAKWNKPGAFQEHMDTYYKPKTGASSSGYSPMGSSAFATEDMTPEQRDQYFGRVSSPQIILNTFDKFGVRDRTQAALNEMKVSQVFNYGTIQAGSPQESIQLTKALDDFLVGKPINSVAMPTAYDLSTGTKVEDTAILGNYLVDDYGYHAATNTFEFVLYNKDAIGDNKWKKVHVSGDYLSTNLPILRMTQAPAAKLANIVLMEKPIGGTPDNPEIYSRPISITKQVVDTITGATKDVEVPGLLNIRSIGGGTPTVSFSLENGQPFFTDKDGDPSTKFRNVDDPELKSVVETGLIKF